MSIIWTLKKVLDPVRARQEELQRKADRERPKREVAAGSGPMFRCTVCGHLSPEPVFCPHCLADTLELDPSTER